MLPKIYEGADREEKREWLSDLVRIVILIWSAGLLTASYVRLPGGQKVMDFDPTFIASVFSGSLAGFGVAIASKHGAAQSGAAAPMIDSEPVHSRPRDEEENTEEEPPVRPVWGDPESDLEQRVGALETKVEGGDDRPNYTRGDL
jgi:hypothetical protein